MDAILQDLLGGRLLDGRYRVGRRIARGGMATVYEALDTRLDRTVALKVMHAGLAEDEDFVARFIREAKSAARLSHPNVVAVFDQGRDGGRVFLAMEHVEGRTLRDLMRERRQLSPAEAFDVLEPVLAALGAAHQAGIVHRDVKPENVLLADDGRVKVADFGLARAVHTTSDHATTVGVLMGTVAYLSPEQVERGVADARSDVYAAGILLYEMLTGRKPHEGDSPLQVAFKHVHDDVPAPSERAEGLASEVDALVASATSRDADRRPLDANSYLAEVLRVRRGMSQEQLDHRGATAEGEPGEHGVNHAIDLTDAALADTAESRTGGAHTLVVNLPGDTTGPLPDTARRGRRRPLLFALLVALAVAVAVAVGGWYVVAGPGAYTAVPSVIEQTSADATLQLETAGLRPEVVSVFSEDVAADVVVSTDPAPNGRVRKGGQVEVRVSQGPERFDVPDLTGRTPEEAQAALAAVNLVLGSPTEGYSDTVPAGQVLIQDPAPGTEVRRDSAVDVVVSQGIEPIPVPDLAGVPLEEARASLAAVGLGLETSGEEVSRTVPAGSIVSQAPAGGTLPKGQAVTVAVSTGPPLVEVPNVADLKVADARAVLQERGFQVQVDGTQILDRVFDQSPNAGQAAPEGSTVTLESF